MPKKSKVTPWTDDEIQYLKDNYMYHTAPEIAKRLGRTIASVKGQIKYLKLKKPTKKGIKHNVTKTKAYNGTLCWNCENAYAHKCLWIFNGTRVWSKGIVHTCEYTTGTGTKHVQDMVCVEECPHFVLDHRIKLKGDGKICI